MISGKRYEIESNVSWCYSVIGRGRCMWAIDWYQTQWPWIS